MPHIFGEHELGVLFCGMHHFGPQCPHLGCQPLRLPVISMRGCTQLREQYFHLPAFLTDRLFSSHGPAVCGIWRLIIVCTHMFHVPKVIEFFIRNNRDHASVGEGIKGDCRLLFTLRKYSFHSMRKAKSAAIGKRMILRGRSNEHRRFMLSRRQTTLHVTAVRGSESVLTITCSAFVPKILSMNITLESCASLTVIFVWEGQKPVTIAQRICVAKGARLHVLNITRGPCTHDAVSEVTGADAESRIDWAVHGRGTMECRLSARNIFRNKNGTGDLCIRGVAEERAKILCDGSVEIGPKASGTHAHLVEQILLLDPTARASAVPSLDVKTHDVLAGHSASVSRIHPEDLFYFSSRGIAARSARSLIIRGFLGDLLSGVEAIWPSLLHK